MTTKTMTILIADDDEDDRLMTMEALRDSRWPCEVQFVSDGVELMDYLKQQGDYKNVLAPDLILLDLNMPKKDGKEALADIKSDPNFRRIPIVILTTSKAEEDVLKTYDLGVNSFITKPVSFDALVDIMKTMNRYWCDIVKLPV